VIPEHELPDDMGASIRQLIASEPAYYAHRDQLWAGYQDAVANGREPTPDERYEARRRRVRAMGQVMREADRIVRREARRLRDQH
jgi:hypothetical protein